jgi:hypothetical protein
MDTTLLPSPGRRGFFDLGFREPDVVDRPETADPSLGLGPVVVGPPPLMLGRKKSTLGWDIAAWLAVAAGIFARQGLDLPALVWKISNVSPGAVVASVVVGLAVFPMMMRWLNRRRRRASLEHVAAPFAFGFFLDLAVVAAVRIPASITSQV